MIKDGNISTLAFIPANNSIPPLSAVTVDPVTGSIYFTAVASANMLVTALPTAIPTRAQQTHPPSS